jgi:CHAT domain-containing protein
VLPGFVHLDEAFTRESIREAIRRRYPVLHIASHYQFSPGNETNSFLLLGVSSNEKNRLRLSEISGGGFDFNGVELITLSACNTAVGGGNLGDGREVEGLGVAVQRKGARGVLATLWPVADKSTAIFMKHLYRRKTEGDCTKVRALRETQLAFVRGEIDPAYTHPYYWAPFLLMGHWL